jgi:hypothetical protein
MVKGLEIFRVWFKDYADQYVLIGGTAASLAMQSAGLDFRATKDLDVVLHLEALTSAFGRRFWEFIEAGRYNIRQSATSGKPQLFRFQKPAEETFPFMIELFARAPLGIDLAPESHLTPIPLDELVSSLSAILLDDTYYDFIMGGRKNQNGLPWVGEDRLIPLKALAWLSLTQEKSTGGQVDSKNIKKHLSDIVALTTLLSPAMKISIDAKIATDLKRFILAVSGSTPVSTEATRTLDRLTTAYGLQ